MLSPKRAPVLAPETPPMSPSTSSQLASADAATTSFSDLPNDCIIDILSFVGSSSSSASSSSSSNGLRDLGRALCAAPWLRELSAHAWAATVRRRWPVWAAIADAAREKKAIAELLPNNNNPKAKEIAWRRQAELFELREREELAVAPLVGGAIAKRQEVVQPRHRAVLAEWLAEVSWDWSCESTVIYRAVSYLDTYMASVGVAELGKYQLLGIAALRAAMADKAAATRAAAARKAAKGGKAEVVAAAEKTGDEGSEPASKKQKRATGEEERREESPEMVVVVEVAAALAAAEEEAASRESSPEAPVTPDVSGMEEEEAEDAGEAEVASTAAAAAAATAATAVEATTSSDEDATADDNSNNDKELDPTRFSHISDRAYSPQDVVDATAKLVAVLPAQLRTRAPNAKMFLRSFWYRAVAGGALLSSSFGTSSSTPFEKTGASAADADVPSTSNSTDGGEKMHVYTLASFFLQLSLLDQESAEVVPSAAAAGALSLALEIYSPSSSSDADTDAPSPSASSSACWPACLQRYSGIAADAVALQRQRLRRVQREYQAPHLRSVWASRHEQHGYPEFSREWGLALRTMKQAGEV